VLRGLGIGGTVRQHLGQQRVGAPAEQHAAEVEDEGVVGLGIGHLSGQGVGAGRDRTAPPFHHWSNNPVAALAGERSAAPGASRP